MSLLRIRRHSHTWTSSLSPHMFHGRYMWHHHIHQYLLQKQNEIVSKCIMLFYFIILFTNTARSNHTWPDLVWFTHMPPNWQIFKAHSLFFASKVISSRCCKDETQDILSREEKALHETLCNWLLNYLKSTHERRTYKYFHKMSTPPWQSPQSNFVPNY